MQSQQPHKWSVAGFHQMAQAGVFSENDRMELIDGEIFDMAPMGNMHRGLIIELTGRFSDAFRGKALVSPQCPVILGDSGEPEPDFAILKLADYRRKEPCAEDIHMIVEVSDTTLDFDRNKKLPMYARHEIPEVWIVNVPDEVLEIYTQPVNGVYQSIKRLASPETVLTRLGVKVDCNQLF